MPILNFLRGSEWRKWDLQVQTILDERYISLDTYWDDLKLQFPEKCNKLISIIGSEDLIKKFDSKNYFFTDSTDNLETRSNNYAKLLLNFTGIFNDEIGAIGITDHNYDHEILIDALVKQSKDSVVKVIPGIEINVQGVHMLIFFSKIPYEQKSYSEGIKLFLSKLEINNKKKNGSLTISNKSYTDVLSEIKGIDALPIYPHCNSNNGLFQERGKTDRTHLADQFGSQAVNILQAKNKSSADKTSGYINSNSNLKSKHIFTLGSDARCLKDIAISDDNGNYCWIKADPTFKGLESILYELDDRVKIQESKPDVRENYQIIDRVKFLDQSFTQEEIFLNQNLTVIIGGKSTGKSVLLRNIASTIDKKEVESRISGMGLQSYPSEVSNFEVKWRDGQESVKTNSNISKKIIYIPQSYLNRLVDKKETQTPISKIVEDALRQDDLVKKSFDAFEIIQREIEKDISVAVGSLFFIEKDIQDLSIMIKNIGDKHGIELEIKKLEVEINTLKESSGISSEEMKKYDDLKESYTKLNDQKTINKKDLEILTSLNEQRIFVAPNLLQLSSEIQKSLNQEYESISQKYLQEWNKKISTIVDEINAKEVELDASIKTLVETGKPLSEKVKLSKSLNENITLLQKERERLKQIVIEEEKLKNKKTEFDSLIKQIADNNAKFYDNFLGAKKEILKQKIISGEEIKFDISIEFKANIFQENFVNEVCNRNKNSGVEPKLDNYQFVDNTKLRDDIKKAIESILSGTLTLKGNYTKQEAIKKLVQNWFIFHYEIKEGSDDISSMSPGKKSFIVLKLLIELNNDRCPILLDQPEDDLDNRSIYNDLVKFIKDKKKDRQIIIVTHNPNLTVGADAECVIVANQCGAKSKNKSHKFEYISGSLENSFIDKNEDKTLYKQGIREHVCDILEGGEIAFEKRKNKYRMN